MTTPEASPLGKPVRYGGSQDPSLLFPIDRAASRAALGLTAELPFTGVDLWNAYELSWLDPRGKPRVALCEIRVPATSPFLIESKSLKLYLGSYAQTRLADSDSLRAQLVHELGQVAGAPVSVVLTSAHGAGAALEPLEGEVIDDLPLDIQHYGPPRPGFIATDPERRVEETLVSHLLKSNCPVTGQPDWASVQIRYAGARLERDGLLRYLVSFREHAGFHESCVEQIFIDLLRHASPTRLSVYARYTRRGGLDINPYRATAGMPLPGNPRTPRQ